MTAPARAALGVIPARGGSKRVPRKNIRAMAGRSLIAYSIEAALASGVFARVVVSTDDEEIARIARAGRGRGPVREGRRARRTTSRPSRPPPRTPSRGSIPHGALFSDVAQLMANCPLRTAEDVRESHAAFLAGGAPAQISVAAYGWQNPWWALTRDVSGRIQPVFPERLQQRSQDLPPLVCPTGAIWWARAGDPAGRAHVSRRGPCRVGAAVVARDRHRHGGGLATGRGPPQGGAPGGDSVSGDRLVVYTTWYPGVEPYLDAWGRSLRAQTDPAFRLVDRRRPVPRR